MKNTITCPICNDKRDVTYWVKDNRKRCTKCWNINRPKKHGYGNESRGIYSVWKNMKQRCLNATNKSYENYGGRGITINDEWLKSENFISWALSSGYREGLELDRRDNDLGYSPENCRWVDKSTQMLNRRVKSDSITGKRGVGWHKQSGTYRVRICINKKVVTIGPAKTIEEGAQMYNDYIDKHNLPNKKN